MYTKYVAFCCCFQMAFSIDVYCILTFIEVLRHNLWGNMVIRGVFTCIESGLAPNGWGYNLWIFTSRTQLEELSWVDKATMTLWENHQTWKRAITAELFLFFPPSVHINPQMSITLLYDPTKILNRNMCYAFNQSHPRAWVLPGCKHYCNHNAHSRYFQASPKFLYHTKLQKKFNQYFASGWFGMRHETISDQY